MKGTCRRNEHPNNEKGRGEEGGWYRSICTLVVQGHSLNILICLFRFPNDILQFHKFLLSRIKLTGDFPRRIPRNFFVFAQFGVGVHSILAALHILDFGKGLLSQRLFLVVAVRAPKGPVHGRIELLQIIGNRQSS